MKILSQNELDDSDPRSQSHADLHLEFQTAKCSLWWNQVPPLEGEKLGVIGLFESNSKEDSIFILEKANSILKEHLCTKAVGPMNGNTWQNYRFVTKTSERDPFFMEPQQPPDWPQWWQDAGFENWQKYCSLIQPLSEEDPRAPRVLTRLSKNGVHIRPINTSEFERDLKAVFKVCLDAFRQNVLYTDVDESIFLSKYLPFADKLDPRFVLVAESEGQCCGFIFSVPDLSQKQRGKEIDTIILKTLAINPNRKFAGLGILLVDLVQKEAREAGLKYAIHALMHNNNSSANIGKHAEFLREYTLFSKSL